MGKFAKFLGKVTISVNNENLELDNINIEDAQRLVDLSKQKENELVNGVKVISDIISKSYPEEPKAEIESFVLKNYTALTEEIIIALGWTTREKLEAQKKEFSEKKIQ